jgi:hypothetical protein
MPKIRIPAEGPSSFKLGSFLRAVSRACLAKARVFSGAAHQQSGLQETTQNSLKSRFYKTILRVPAKVWQESQGLDRVHLRESLDSSNAIALVHKIWRACPCGFRTIRARRMDFVGRRTSYFPRIEVVSISQEMRGRSVHIENCLL